jgi:hypothetical protein
MGAWVIMVCISAMVYSLLLTDVQKLVVRLKRRASFSTIDFRIFSPLPCFNLPQRKTPLPVDQWGQEQQGTIHILVNWFWIRPRGIGWLVFLRRWERRVVFVHHLFLDHERILYLRSLWLDAMGQGGSYLVEEIWELLIEFSQSLDEKKKESGKKKNRLPCPTCRECLGMPTSFAICPKIGVFVGMFL